MIHKKYFVTIFLWEIRIILSRSNITLCIVYSLFFTISLLPFVVFFGGGGGGGQ